MMKSLIPMLVMLMSGCAESFREARQADLRQRASFEFKCPADQIQVTALDAAARSHGGGTTGVSGCGKQATYVWDAYGTGWIMNSTAQPPR